MPSFVGYGKCAIQHVSRLAPHLLTVEPTTLF